MDLSKQRDGHEPKLALQTVLYFASVILFLCVFQSASLLTLSYDLPPNQMSEFSVSLCEAWHTQMQSLGAAGLTEWISEFVGGLHEKTIN